MNSFANALFSAFFSWLRSVVQMIYRAVTQPGRVSLLSFIADHWVVILVILLVIGTAADLTVYLFRWRPFEVWASYFRRKSGRGKRRAGGGSAADQEPIRSVGMVPEDDAYVIPDTGLQRTPETLTYEDPMTDIEYGTMEENAGEEGADLYEENPGMQEESLRRRRSKTPIRKGIRHLIRRILAEEEEEGPTLKYNAAQPPVDERDAYGDPYIPPQWKQPEEKIVRNKRRGRENRDDGTA